MMQSIKGRLYPIIVIDLYMNENAIMSQLKKESVNERDCLLLCVSIK